jgi:hypothetical protein
VRAKTIKAILQKKHNDFVASIDDLHVKELVKKNSIITGGCIVSMLLKEKVNDYDYYFTNKETALAVTTYYVDKFNEANPAQKPELKVQVKVDDHGRIRVWIQSQGVTSEDGPDGYKYFECDASPDDAENFVEQATEILDGDAEDKNKPHYRPIFLTSNAITLSDKVQLVIRFYGDAAEIHSNYDFAHCLSYWKSEDGELVLPNEALQAILAKELVYKGSKYPIASVIRTRKFIGRGWVINAGQYLKMCMQIGELDLKDPAVLEDQLVGVDFAYFQAIINYLKERKEKDEKFEINAAYIIEIVDRLF